MTQVIKTNNSNSVVKKANETAREFIGKAWINTVKQGKCEGMQFINVTLDNNIQEVTLNKSIKIQLWPNKKREGHSNDADYRVSVLSPIATA